MLRAIGKHTKGCWKRIFFFLFSFFLNGTKEKIQCEEKSSTIHKGSVTFFFFFKCGEVC